MKQRTYSIEGWLAITSACLVIPAMIMGILAGSILHASIVFKLLSVMVSLLQAAISVFVFYRFRDFLNDKFQFHDVDLLILFIVIGSILIAMVSGFGSLVTGPDDMRMKLLLLLPIAMLGIPTSILGIIFAVKILKLPDDLHGLLKPYAYITIIQMIFFISIIFAFLGMLLVAVADLILGMIYLKSDQIPTEAEFV